MKKMFSLCIMVFCCLNFAGCGNNIQNDVNNRMNNNMMNNNMISNSTIIEETEMNTYKQIGMQEAIQMMEEEENYIILDVRRLDEFQDKHIPNAINIPNESIGTDEIPELPDKEQLILVYCRSGNRSKQASLKLVNLGYTNIVEFGGIIDWPGEVVSEMD